MLKNRIHTQIIYKTKDQKEINVYIGMKIISIKVAPSMPEMLIKSIAFKNNCWKWNAATQEFYKEIKTIKYGLYNMFHKKDNFIGHEIDKFIKESLMIKDATVDIKQIDGGITIEQVKAYKKEIIEKKANKIPAEPKDRKDSSIWPIYKPEYSAEIWKEISHKAYEKRKNYYASKTEQTEKLVKNAFDPITAGVCLVVGGILIWLNWDNVPYHTSKIPPSPKDHKLEVFDLETILSVIGNMGVYSQGIITIICVAILIITYVRSKNLQDTDKEKIGKNDLGFAVIIGALLVTGLLIWHNLPDNPTKPPEGPAKLEVFDLETIFLCGTTHPWICISLMLSSLAMGGYYYLKNKPSDSVKNLYKNKK